MGVLRRRGLTTLALGLAGRWRFSLEAAERRAVLGTGSLEGRGIPLGLGVDGSMTAIAIAHGGSRTMLLSGLRN